MTDDSLPPELAFGACCACGKGAVDGVLVRNIVMLNKKALEPGKGWGCVVCGLAFDGACAVICDACQTTGAEIKEAFVGYAPDGRRCAIAELTEPHEHDGTKHVADDAHAIAAAAYEDPSYPERPCDRCDKPYRGPAVYCSLQCALDDA